MSVLDELLIDKYLLRDVLCVYASLLKERKQLHEGNCPECEEKERPCKRYYWLFRDIQAVEYYIEKLGEEIRDTAVVSPSAGRRACSAEQRGMRQRPGSEPPVQRRLAAIGSAFTTLLKPWIAGVLLQVVKKQPPRSGTLQLSSFAAAKMAEQGLTQADIEDAFRFGEEVKAGMLIRRFSQYQVGVLFAAAEKPGTYVIRSCWKR